MPSIGVLFRLCDSTSRIFLRDRRQFGAVTLTVARDRVNSVLDPSRAASPPRRWCTPPTSSGHRCRTSSTAGRSRSPSTIPLDAGPYSPGGSVRAILARDIQLTGPPVGYVPPDQRFYGGGPSSVRGYGRNELGPRVYVITVRDSTGIDPVATAQAGDTVWRGVTTAPTGGNTALVLNAELRFPSPIFAQRMRLGLFVDAGQVWERGDSLTTIHGIRITPRRGPALRNAARSGADRCRV